MKNFKTLNSKTLKQNWRIRFFKIMVCTCIFIPLVPIYVSYILFDPIISLRLKIDSLGNVQMLHLLVQARRGGPPIAMAKPAGSVTKVCLPMPWLNPLAALQKWASHYPLPWLNPLSRYDSPPLTARLTVIRQPFRVTTAWRLDCAGVDSILSIFQFPQNNEGNNEGNNDLACMCALVATM